MISGALYQVVILGAGASSLGRPLEDLVRERLSDLGGELVEALRIIFAPDIADIVATAPIVAVYFGGSSVIDETEVKQLLVASVPIIPVVDDLDQYTARTPEALHPINGIAVAGSLPDLTAVVNIILENLSLLRKSRRLFLSYLRKEGSQVAHQLRASFDNAGYDAFLDTSSVPAGDDFQAVLWHRLLDSDVMVVLDTTNFLTSRWTTKELAEASAMSVGLLRVVWPGVDRAQTAELAIHLYLDKCDVEGNGLTDIAVKRITVATEALRARCIAARHNNLVVEFCEEASRVGASTIIQPGRYVVAKMPDGRRIVAVPAVGVPDAQRYHEASERFPNAGGTADEAVLLYDHRGMLSSWRGFLDWLDKHLPITGLRVTETSTKLGAVR